MNRLSNRAKKSLRQGLTAAASLMYLVIVLTPSVLGQSPTELADRLALTTKSDQFGRISTGQFRVYEDRHAQSGRQLELDVVVLHATGEDPRPDPIFPLAGGPGQAATTLWRQYANSWMRKDRDIVLIDQRGTGGSSRLDLPPTNEDGLEQFLEVFPTPERVQVAERKLSQKADLRMYSTPLAMDDLDDLRLALGYEKINVTGGSYGTRAALVYIRQHGDSVRTAILNGVAPIEFTNPLFHAREAQAALEMIFDEVESSATYREAFPDLGKKFEEILERFDQGPVDVEVDAGSGHLVTIALTREAFTSSLRVQLYSLYSSRRVPLLLLQAYRGDFRPFVESAIARNRGLANSLAMGMLLSVTAAEDVARIHPDDIPTATAGTFLGDVRVRRQIEACRDWPKSELPPNFGDPVKSDVPTLILSGTLDPVTPPRWGELVHGNFPNSLHIIAPAAHGVGGRCIDEIEKAFLDTGTVEGLDVSCVKSMELPPLALPKD